MKTKWYFKSVTGVVRGPFEWREHAEEAREEYLEGLRDDTEPFEK